jgi:hypothetical protein
MRLPRRGQRPFTGAERSVEAGREGRLALVHLVRAANGPSALRDFAATLRRHAPGVEHKLVLAMKGFTSFAQAQTHLDEVAELADLDYQTLIFPDTGKDLNVYFASVARLRCDRYCFVNSFSVPLVDGWLAKLDRALDQGTVGLVGATGSWGSTRSWLAYACGLPSAYRGSLPSADVVRQQLLASQPAQPDARRNLLRELAAAVRQLFGSEPFPGYHIRTNVFMVERPVVEEVRTRTVRDELDARMQEAGRRSITRQVHRMGLRTLVVDRAGVAYDHTEWDRSRTFWQGDQEQLLVADNRTLVYQQGGPLLRRVLSGLAWGPNADPCVDLL